MGQRSARVHIEDMLDAIRGIGDTIAGIDFETYAQTWHIKRATERGFEIISEASRHVPEESKALAPDIPWARVAAIGNRLRHEYQRIDDRILWNLAGDELPRLKAALERMLADLDRCDK